MKSITYNEALEERLNETEYRLDSLEDELENIYINTHINFDKELENIEDDLLDQKQCIKFLSFITVFSLIINMIIYIRRKK